MHSFNFKIMQFMDFLIILDLQKDAESLTNYIE